MTPAQLHWLAGLLEGEAMFGFYDTRNKDGRLYQYPFIELKMTDEDVVQRAAQLMGITSIVTKPPIHSPLPRKDAYAIRLSGERAFLLMQELYPLMGQRRQEKFRALFERFEPKYQKEAA